MYTKCYQTTRPYPILKISLLTKLYNLVNDLRNKANYANEAYYKLFVGFLVLGQLTVSKILQKSC
jgi:hypothetical protein